jgi:hypothetical protein
MPISSADTWPVLLIAPLMVLVLLMKIPVPLVLPGVIVPAFFTLPLTVAPTNATQGITRLLQLRRRRYPLDNGRRLRAL